MSLQEIFATRATRMKASEIRELLKLLDQPDIISFAGGIPDPDLFPKAAFQDAFAEALNGPMAAQGLQYSTSEGHKPLRVWIAAQMQAIGIPAAPDNILITSGSQQALDYLGKLFLSPGDTALVGWPTYLGALGAFNAYEPRYDKLDPLSNRSGADYTAAAKDAGGAAKFAYLSVDFANPTGATVSRAARERVIDLAEEMEIAVIEDAAYQSLRFDGDPIPPILALEAARKGGDLEACRTIYCGSFSKTLSPGLRVGWVCAAMPVISQLVLMKQAADLHSATLNQIAISSVAEQHFESHIDTIRSAYRARRDAMLAALEAHMPKGVSWTKPEGGMFIWVTLPDTLDGAELLKQSLESERVAFVPGHAFFADGSGRNTLRLSYSTSTEDKIAEGIERLGQLISRALNV
ncbi:MAG: PLP-dependent aminotransferase family protein [Sulfitobacter litoralis]|jgi:DNA-binding transcriptional MocR family regulator|uniref:aminotransferase-like domain-containing protein n=1 Tax=Sulfitobacter TaxID=60136 RepID=UPI001B7A4958|nr:MULTISPECIES: PLP-dependent aminotransferase family protein [Sulfitobacter]MBQ0767201.1 PLP-dependent aminotransferase family protein [Sulfitobacter litoralis]MCF7727230.1 aminotransferase class I/II-fold pyridoxal phosphate-dependent enzyme [Sulfitobacter sp. M22]MCF7778594.1 aminotransferase class I/II-fold pyridoxal phosphate-dependent enzyme [Sulfitobacter sp. M220]|tara:strand:+ start:2088 stop:3308 length:1221 start_codon:yes stop_codon:yes gene_type:complete